MFRTMICAKDLELIALREIQSFPGGEHVAHVEIDRPHGDWSLAVTARDGADFAQIRSAVETAIRRLKQKYSLRADW